MPKPVVGLTGGIASGKSTVAKMLAARGIPIVDADQLAREVVAPGTPGLRAIVDTFGPEYLDGDSLDRKKLGALVFEDAEARQKLNAITHPRIAQAGMQKIASLQSHTAPYLCYEAALLVENGLHRAFAALVVVAVARETQLARLMARDDCDADAARARIASQMPLEEKVAVATHVVWNDGPREETEARVAEVHAALLESFA